MNANTGLRDAVLQAVRPYLGTYSEGGEVRGPAFWPPPTKETQLEPPKAYKAAGLEVVVRLYPEDHDGIYEFGDEGLRGVLHYPVTLKAWQGSTWPARGALFLAFPLLTTNIAQRVRHVPSDEAGLLVETTTVFVPVLTD